MASLDDLEARVTALEADMRAARHDAAAARVLAGGADRDVSAFAARLDALQKLVAALRETQIEHGQRLRMLEQRMDRLEEKVDRGFATLAVGQSEILALLRRAED